MTRTLEFHCQIIGPTSRSADCLSQSQQAAGYAQSFLDQVISKRMVKKQQMRWSWRGAHDLLQIRTQVLNEELRATVSRWYPGFDPHIKQQAA